MTYKQVFGNKTCKEIYLDYVNNWITMDNMASFYGCDVSLIESAINEGRKIHNQEVAWNKKADKFIQTGSYY